MMIKQIVSVTLAFSLASSLYGAEEKQMESNEFEVSESSEMPPVSKPPVPPLVRDNKTEIVYDPTTKLMWQDNSEVKNNGKKWQDAITYCDNLTFGGYSDWRLPDIKELLSISDMTRDNPAIKSEFQNVGTNFYWSSSTYAFYSGGAWGVHFNNGNVNTDGKGGIRLVRCVRNSN